MERSGQHQRRSCGGAGLALPACRLLARRGSARVLLFLYFLLAPLVLGSAARTRLNNRGGAADHPLVSGHKYYIFPEQLGVYHYLLPGHFGGVKPADEALQAGDDSGGSSNVTSGEEVLGGNLHVFLRAVDNNTHFLLRGFFYFDNGTEPQLSANAKIVTPQRLTRWVPSLVAAPEDSSSSDESSTDASSGAGVAVLENVTIGTVPAADFCKPVAVSGVLPREGAARYTLQVQGGERVIPLGAVVVSAQPSVAEDGVREPQVYSVVASWVEERHHALATAALRAHADYHRRLGFVSTLAYLRPAVLLRLAGDLGVQGLVRSQQLVLVSWDYLPHVAGLPGYDQAVAYNHALLTLWQRGAWAFLAEVNTFLAVPGSPANVAQLLAGCLGGAQNKLRSYHAVCEECGDQEESQWLEEVQEAAHSSPLLRYRLRSKALQGVKSLVNPDRVHQFFIHDGNVMDLDLDKTVVANETGCAYVAHLTKLFEEPTIVGDVVEASDWLWPVNSSLAATGSPFE